MPLVIIVYVFGVKNAPLTLKRMGGKKKLHKRTTTDKVIVRQILTYRAIFTPTARYTKDEYKISSRTLCDMRIK